MGSVSRAQSLAHCLDQILMRPTGDTALGAGGASALQRAGPAFVGPVLPGLNTALLGGVAVDQFLARPGQS